MSTSSQYDFVVIGGGSAGYAAARTAVSLGLRTAAIDNAAELGGLCILRGCMPSKSLIESANRNLVIRRAAEFGLNARMGEPDLPAIQKRKRWLIDDFAGYRQQQLQDGRFELIRARASFSSATSEQVVLNLTYTDDGSTSTLTAASVLIATGSVIRIPDIPGLKESNFWTSDTLLDAEYLPESITILGGGAIALEFAHYLEGIGRKVTLIQRGPQLLSGFDPDIATVITESFKSRGIEIFTNTSIQSVENLGNAKRVTFLDQNGQTLAVENQEILVALGRNPATHSLQLASAGIDAHANGQVAVQHNQLTSHPRVFAAGDVCGPLEVVHLAIQQGEIAAKNAAAILDGKTPQLEMDYRCKLYGIFTEPQIAIVGISEAEAFEKNIPFISASYPFNDHGKSMVMGETEGFVKLLADPINGKLLGAAAVGPEAVELIHQPAIAIHLNATAFDFLSAPWYHPTLSEIWSYPAEEINDLINERKLP